MLALALSVLLASHSIEAAVIESQYLGAFRDGAWSDATLWSENQVPNNNATNTYNVNLTGGSVWLNISPTINNLDFGDASSGDLGTLNSYDQSLTVLGTTSIRSGLLFHHVESGTRTIDLGTLVEGARNRLIFANLYLEAEAGSEAVIRFNDANIVINEGYITLGGTGVTRIVDQTMQDGLRNFALNEEGGRFQVVNGHSHTIGNAFANHGTLAALYGGQLTLTNLTNFDATTNTLNSGPLDSGRYEVYANGESTVLRFGGANIVTLNAVVLLSGADAHLVDLSGADALRNLETIGSEGEFQIHSRSHTLKAGMNNMGSIVVDGGTINVAGNFSNSGSVTVESNNPDNSSFAVEGQLTNFNSGTGRLSGGSYRAFSNDTGTSVIRIPGLNVTALDADVFLHGAGARIVDENGLNALRNLDTIVEEASFGISSQAFTILGGLSNSGLLSVYDGAILTVNGSYTGSGVVDVVSFETPSAFLVNGPVGNFNPGTRRLSGEYNVYAYDAPATVRLPGVDVLSLAGRITALGGSTRIVDENGNDVLRNLAQIEAEGELFIRHGYSLSVAGSLRNEGRLDIYDATGETRFSVAGSLTNVGAMFLDDAVVSVAPGKDLLNEGYLSASGSLEGNLKLTEDSIYSLYFWAFQGAAEIEFEQLMVSGSAILGGELELELQVKLAPSSDAVFDILVAAGGVTGSFTNVLSGGRLFTEDGKGSFLVSYGSGADADRVRLSNFVPIPEPQTAVMLAFALGPFLARRRRCPAATRKHQPVA